MHLRILQNDFLRKAISREFEQFAKPRTLCHPFNAVITEV